MSNLWNKLIILLYCLVLISSHESYTNIIVSFLIVFSCSCFISYFSKPFITLILFLIYSVACIFYPPLLFFSPLLCYDIFAEENQKYGLVLFIPFIIQWNIFSYTTMIILLFMLIISFVLKKQAFAYLKLKKDYSLLRDSSVELTEELARKNTDLLEKQDYEINLATLNERNRIAKEIHDTVGHLLSSAIIQIGAILAITTDPQKKEALCTVKDTLSTGMNSIRNSIHKLYDESLDLEANIRGLLDHFAFCGTTFNYQIQQDPPMKVKYSLITIVKEALANIMKHSDATLVQLTISEHPAFYQMIIYDNGQSTSINPLLVQKESNNGIGLNNIADRVSTLNGNLYIEQTNGFRIFISIPKNIDETK